MSCLPFGFQETIKVFVLKCVSLFKTVEYSDQEIIKTILDLHIKEDRFDLDPTFSSGKFWKGLIEPIHKSDLYPQRDDVKKCDCNNLDFPDCSLKSICFDPPFLAGYTTGDKTGIIGKRFEGFRYITDVWSFYEKSLSEFHRVLKNGGWLAFKNQDTVSSGKQFFSHCFIYDTALKVGFEAKDLFVNVAKNRMIGHNHKIQKHARKFHSYWWLFRKINLNI